MATATTANHDSFNVSGLTDNGTGRLYYTITIDNDMANDDYAHTCNGAAEQVISPLNALNTLTGSVRLASSMQLRDSTLMAQGSKRSNNWRLGMSTLRTNALEGVDAKNSITIVAGAGNITTTNVQEGLCKAWVNLMVEDGCI